jgi:Lrp/AsnC family transcriptional regulator, regulator for asnA, asnC and gidA
LTTKLDAKDKKLLNILQENGRAPYSQLADEIGLSEATVRYRIKKLMDAGVIKNFTVLLDPKKIGYSTTGILMVKISPDFFEEASKQISVLNETHHVFQNTGEYDIVAVVQAHGLEHLSDLKKRVEMIKGVKDVSLSATTRLIKIKTKFDL